METCIIVKIKKLLKKYGSEFAIDFIGKRNRDNALNDINRMRCLECVVSIAPRAEDECKFTAVLPYFFNNCFILSQ